MTTTTYPNGQQLVSSALTTTDINKLLQVLTCGVLGINPPNYAAVRVDWPTQGQPFGRVTDDVCYFLCVPQDEQYNRVRDREYSGTSAITETWTYTKCWRLKWTFYGPNSQDRARALRSATFMDYFNDQLAVSNLYPLSDPPEVVRAPEEINAEWWERTDFHLEVYEKVTETIDDGAATSVEVKVNDNSGQVADITISTI